LCGLPPKREKEEGKKKKSGKRPKWKGRKLNGRAFFRLIGGDYPRAKKPRKRFAFRETLKESGKTITHLNLIEGRGGQGERKKKNLGYTHFKSVGGIGKGCCCVNTILGFRGRRKGTEKRESVTSSRRYAGVRKPGLKPTPGGGGVKVGKGGVGRKKIRRGEGEGGEETGTVP